MFSCINILSLPKKSCFSTGVCFVLSGCRRFAGEDPLEAFLEQVAKDLALEKEDLIVRPVSLVLPRALVSLLVTERLHMRVILGLFSGPQLVAHAMWSAV
jgi:hypothetical protein